MNERQRAPRESESPAGGLGHVFGHDDRGGLVTVASGPYAEQLPVGQSTVGEVRARYRDRFDIDPRSQAIVDGNDVSDDTILRTGQVLMFVHRAGEKGGQGAGGRRQGAGGRRQEAGGRRQGAVISNQWEQWEQ